MQNFHDNGETRKGLFISAFSICLTVPLIKIESLLNNIVLFWLVYCIKIVKISPISKSFQFKKIYH